MDLSAALCLFLGALFFPASGFAAEAAVVDRIVAVVNEDIISLYDVDSAMRPVVENIKKQRFPADQERQALARLREDMIDTLIENKLTEQEVKRYNISVSDEEVDAYIRQIRQRRSYTEQELQANLAAQGMSMEDYRREVKSQLQRTKLVNREVKSKVVITQAEIKSYYEKNSAKYGGGKQYHLWNLLVKVPRNPNPEQRQQAQALFQEVLAELKQGRSFEELAKLSADGAKGIQGNDLGLFRIDELTPQLREAVRKLKPGEYSPAIETEFGYQTVYVQKLAETPARPLSEVETEIQDVLYREFVEGKFKSWIADLRKRSHVKIMGSN
jgi:peptidyl-prolyl cis-trans isomerase SurA